MFFQSSYKVLLICYCFNSRYR